jgi:peptidylprolyl isomerase
MRKLAAFIAILALAACSGNENIGESAMTIEILPGLTINKEMNLDTEPVLNWLGRIEVGELLAVDLLPGTGPAVKISDTLMVNYLGIGGQTGEIFDSSFTRGEPADFPLQAVIQGWQEGLIGMQSGGRRILVIPAAQAYGDNPPPGSGILPGESLIFVVDLLDIL